MEGKDCPRPLGRKEYYKLGKTVSLMLGICIPIFGSGKSVVLYSIFFVAKVITELKAKVIFAAYLIKKRCYCPEGGPGDLIGTYFENNKVVDVGMIEARNEDNKLFKMFFMK